MFTNLFSDIHPANLPSDDTKCNMESIDVIKPDPSKNIYYCKKIKCSEFHISYAGNILIDAIYFLEIARIKELLDQIDPKDTMFFNSIQIAINENNEITNCVVNDIESEILKSNNSSNEDVNLLDFLFMNIYGGCGNKQIKRSYTKNMQFNRNRKYINKKDIESQKKIIEIIRMICEKFPHYITKKHFEVVEFKNNSHDVIRNILIEHYINDLEVDECFVCFSTHDVHLISNTCVCKNKVHLHCLNKIVKQFGHICTACKKTNEGIIDPYGRIIYPRKNIYKQPIMSMYTIINQTNIYESLFFAIEYLQIARIKEIFENIENNEDVQNFITRNVSRQYLKYINGSLVLPDEMSVYFKRNQYNEQFIEIERLLNFKIKSIKFNK